jgi:hypothetical protein
MTKRTRLLIFVLAQVPLFAALALSIATVDRWIVGGVFPIRDLPGNAVIFLSAVGVFLLFVASPVLWLMRDFPRFAGVIGGVVLGVLSAALIDYWASMQEGLVLCRKITLYTMFIAVSGIFGLNFHRRLTHQPRPAR